LISAAIWLPAKAPFWNGFCRKRSKPSDKRTLFLYDSGDLTMSMDDLRREILEQERRKIVDAQNQKLVVSNSTSERMFGMTAAERMFVSIGCFLVTSLGGFLVLLITEKIALP
jgi:hypothetical protein